MYDIFLEKMGKTQHCWNESITEKYRGEVRLYMKLLNYMGFESNLQWLNRR